jgi:penicillin-binding protein 1A
VGFTNEVTVAVWLGYDNAGNKRRTLGGGGTGGGVAVPIFEPVIKAVWANGVPKTALAPPSPAAKRQLVCKPIEIDGHAAGRSARAITECFRSRRGQIVDTQYRLISPQNALTSHARLDGTPAGEVIRSPRAARSRGTVRAAQQWGWGWGAPQRW